MSCNRLPLVAFLALASSLACHPAAAQDLPAPVARLVAAAKSQVRTLDLAAFKSAFDRNDLGLIVDVREPAEFSEGYIPGAINVPRGVIELRIWAHVGFPERTDLNTKITLYCGSGVRCVLAARSLQELGFGNVTAADMKLADWIAAGYPIVGREGSGFNIAPSPRGSTRP